MDLHTRLLVENILRHPGEYAWSVQGLGMMRLYLSEAVRLHVWDSALKVPGVSAIHSHPWDLSSTVIAGRYKQHRFTAVKQYQTGDRFNMALIKCGEGAHTVDEPATVDLVESALETYTEGGFYLQAKDEVHLSCPDDGTVTIVTRTFHEDRDHAKVFWRGKGGWVDARPRPATPEEVAEITGRALSTWF